VFVERGLNAINPGTIVFGPFTRTGSGLYVHIPNIESASFSKPNIAIFVESRSRKIADALKIVKLEGNSFSVFVT